MAKNEINENSVNIALQELMGMEDTRQKQEEEDQQRREAEERKRKDEEAQRRKEEEERKRKEEEERRVAEERTKIETEEMKRREEEERKLKIKLEAESRARAEEQKRMLEHEIQVKRLEAEKKHIPKWVYAVIAIVLIAGGSIAYYMIQESRDREVAARQTAAEEQDKLRKEFAERERAWEQVINQAKKEQEDSERKLKDAEAAGDEAAIAAARANLEKARERTKKVKHDRATKTDKKDDKKKKSGLSDDPLGGFEL